MSDLTFNKVAGALLATGLAIVGLRQLSSGIFATEAPAKPGYAIAVQEGGESGPKVEAPIDWGTVLPAADVNAGAAVFNKCKSCHNADQGGPNSTGPNLWGVEGRQPGSHPGFDYSQGMKDFGAKQPVWDFEHMNNFLEGPQKYISGTKMTFIGLKKKEDRINLLAYLHQQGGTLPFPAPNPAPAADAAAAPADGAAAPAGDAAAAPAADAA
ncbi:cytochrome c family protein, partial [Phenylobacterium sp.]|uniref:c-type cytochrome n=1 Tax=Phenylobacterium sp. TaxID=1871053 RepID=UPI0035B2841B